MTTKERERLWDLGISSIKELEIDRGILASGRGELYGCIFGRDSLITTLMLFRAHARTGDTALLALAGKILAHLSALQGTEVNIESGEEPGKIIHEFRPDRHEHLTAHLERPWHVYPDGSMKNYDSVDSTPLFLLAANVYVRVLSGRSRLSLDALLVHVKAALDWMLEWGDSNGDDFLDYRFHPERTSGGLVTQSWMDSHDSIFHENGEEIVYPIAPVEVQGYAWAALRLWASHFRAYDEAYANRLEARATRLKRAFNGRFVLSSGQEFSLAFAVDGNGTPMTSLRSSMGHLLWAAYGDGNDRECILEKELVPQLVERLMQRDLFVPEAGIRTLSTRSRKFNPLSYHNGSIWPHDCEIVAQGFEDFGYKEEASRVRTALFAAYLHFGTPLEFFTFKDSAYGDLLAENDQQACKTQAWSAAAMVCALLECDPVR